MTPAVYELIATLEDSSLQYDNSFSIDAVLTLTATLNNAAILPIVPVDIGIRIYGQIIAGEILDTNTHKVRIRKDDTTYGIPLVSTDHPSASKARIYDGDEVRAFITLGDI